MVPAITEIINSITKIIASHFAMVNEIPEISPNPNIPAIIATIKNSIAKINQLPTPFLFISLFILFSILFNSIGYL